MSIYSISNTHLLYVQYITDISWQSETHIFVVGLRLNKNENLDNIYQCFMVYGIEHHFQQHFNYIMAISFIGDGVPRENYRPVVSH